MNNYRKKAELLMKLGDAEIAEKRRRTAIIRRTAFAVSGLCAAIAIGIGLWNSNAIKGAITPDPDNAYIQIEDTKPVDTTVATTQTTAEKTTVTTAKKAVTSAKSTSASHAETSTTTANPTTKKSSSPKTTSTSVPTTTATAPMTTTTAWLTSVSTYTLPYSTNLAKTIEYNFDSDRYFYYNMGINVPTTAVDTELGCTPTGYQRDSAVFSIKNTPTDTALAVRDDDDGSYVLYYDLFRFYTSPENGKRYKCKDGGPVFEGNRQFLRTENVIEKLPEIGFAFAHTVDVYTVNGISPDVMLAVRTDGSEFIKAYYGGLDSPQTLRDIYDALAVEQYISYVTHVNIIYDDYILEYSIKTRDKNKEFFDTMLLSERDLPVTKTPPEIHSDRIMQTHIQLGGISFSIKVEITEDGWMTFDMLGDKYYCFIGSEKFTEYENYLKQNSNVSKNPKYY